MVLGIYGIFVTFWSFSYDRNPDRVPDPYLENKAARRSEKACPHAALPRETTVKKGKIRCIG